MWWRGIAGMPEQCSGDDPGRTTETTISALDGLVWFFWALSSSLSSAESPGGTCWGSTFPGFWRFLLSPTPGSLAVGSRNGFGQVESFSERPGGTARALSSPECAHKINLDPPLINREQAASKQQWGSTTLPSVCYLSGVFTWNGCRFGIF